MQEDESQAKHSNAKGILLGGGDGEEQIKQIIFVLKK